MEIGDSRRIALITMSNDCHLRCGLVLQREPRSFVAEALGELLTSSFVCQALADDALDRFDRTGLVIHNARRAVVVAELIFSKVAVQMLLAAMLVDALIAKNFRILARH